jgi:hypothetical protein
MTDNHSNGETREREIVCVCVRVRESAHEESVRAHKEMDIYI